eukprot:5371099-Amphidinium_carterae.1
MLAHPHLIDDMDTGVDCDSIIASMHSSIRELVSAPLMPAFHSRVNNFVNKVKRKKSFADLDKEIRIGRCHLVISSQKEVIRVLRPV